MRLSYISFVYCNTWRVVIATAPANASNSTIKTAMTLQIATLESQIEEAEKKLTEVLSQLK